MITILTILQLVNSETLGTYWLLSSESKKEEIKQNEKVFESLYSV